MLPKVNLGDALLKVPSAYFAIFGAICANVFASAVMGRPTTLS